MVAVGQLVRASGCGSEGAVRARSVTIINSLSAPLIRLLFSA